MKQNDIHDCINNKLKHYFDQLDDEPRCGVFKMVIQQAEVVTIKFVLDKTNQNRSKAARILGINRATLNKKISLYQL